MPNSEIPQNVWLLQQLVQRFDLPIPQGTLTEEAFLEMLTARVSEMLSTQREYLMSLLYRMDVLERELKVVLRPGYPVPTDRAIAELIWQRQKKRMAARIANQKDINIIEEGWEW